MARDTHNHSEMLALSEMAQSHYTNWLIEQVLCGEYEPYVESGFIQTLEELIPLTQYRRIKGKLIEGWKQYWFGVMWFPKSLSHQDWLNFFYCDRQCTLPLQQEVVIIDKDDMVFRPSKRNKK